LPKIDCLAFAPHPDDVELFCGGTLLKLKKQGYRTAVVDLTRGELSTNGTVQSRKEEARQAGRILQLDVRKNLGLPDGNLSDSEKNRKKIIRVIRALRPPLCLLPYWEDRHPDHRDASLLLQKAVFAAGLKKIETGQAAYRPKNVFYYMLHYAFTPSFVVDISAEFAQKRKAVECYMSQFSKTGKKSEATYINRTDFLNSLETRAAYWGQQVGAEQAEAFFYRGVIKIDNLLSFFS
jgi:bacillithiol biosynthesis deacetylase BshB1